MNSTSQISDKSRMVDAILCFCLGGLGAHKFYEGKIGMGILYILTFGLFGIGTLVDFIIILVGSGKDADGKDIVKWLDETGSSVQTNEVKNYSDDTPAVVSDEDKKINTLKQYKDLLDKGAISQAEYDKKKEEILG
jgi:TM2 domain-containing membrane protein YozV